MPTEIRHRRTSTVLYTSDRNTVREATIEAVSSGAYLGGAYLGGAYLRDADLGGAYLGGADLRGAYLRDAYLGGAYLGGADLRDAYLGGAYLGGAYLRGAYLGDAYLGDAYLGGADLRDADLRGADLRGADLGGALAGVPLIANLDAAILAAVENAQADGKAGLDMATWHTCQSTHCRAGWAIHLAGDAGYALEDEYGPAMAGTLIYLRAGATKIPDWYASTDDALADIRERAGVAS